MLLDVNAAQYCNALYCTARRYEALRYYNSMIQFQNQ